MGGVGRKLTRAPRARRERSGPGTDAPPPFAIGRPSRPASRPAPEYYQALTMDQMTMDQMTMDQFQNNPKACVRLAVQMRRITATRAERQAAHQRPVALIEQPPAPPRSMRGQAVAGHLLQHLLLTGISAEKQPCIAEQTRSLGCGAARAGVTRPARRTRCGGAPRAGAVLPSSSAAEASSWRLTRPAQRYERWRTQRCERLRNWSASRLIDLPVRTEGAPPELSRQGARRSEPGRVSSRQRTAARQGARRRSASGARTGAGACAPRRCRGRGRGRASCRTACRRPGRRRP